MSTGGEPGHLFLEVTRRNNYRYFFYDKHHGRGGPEAAQWATDVAEEEEFHIFDEADWFEISDDNGNLYGVRIRQEPERRILLLGTAGQQVAKFPESETGPYWHGFPLAPLQKNIDAPHPPQRPIPGEVLQKMVDAHLLTSRDRKRLRKGKIA
jgi:hypothetical protein